MALRLFAEIHEHEPNQIQPLVEMAIEQRALGQPKKSEELLRRALALDSVHLGALEQLAEHHFLAEDFDEMFSICQRAIAAHPHKLGPYLQASRAAAQLGRKEDAEKFLEAACAMVGQRPEIIALRLSHARKDRDWSKARAMIQQFEAETKRYSALWVQRVALAITTGDYDGAAAALPDQLPATAFEASRVHSYVGRSQKRAGDSLTLRPVTLRRSRSRLMTALLMPT